MRLDYCFSVGGISPSVHNIILRILMLCSDNFLALEYVRGQARIAQALRVARETLLRVVPGLTFTHWTNTCFLYTGKMNLRKLQ